MSSAHDAHGASAHAHDDHDAFDGEPAHELSPGEPRSPGWLPLVGIALFSLAGVYMLSGGDGSGVSLAAPRPLPVEFQAPPRAPAAAPARTNAAAAPQPPAGAAPAPGDAAPAGSGVRKLSPEQVEQLKKRIEDARAKGVLPTRPGQPGAVQRPQKK